MTVSFVLSIFIEPANEVGYLLQYLIFILAFAIVDSASIVQTLYLNYQTNKVSKTRYTASYADGTPIDAGHNFHFHET